MEEKGQSKFGKEKQNKAKQRERERREEEGGRSSRTVVAVCGR